MTTHDYEKSAHYKVGHSQSMFETIIAHLGAAAMQRAPSDDKIIADHIDAALSAAKRGLAAVTTKDRSE